MQNPLPSYPDVAISTLPEHPCLPLVVSPKDINSLPELDTCIQQIVAENLLNTGAILFRGFEFLPQSEFSRFCRSFGFELLNYEFGSTPRSNVAKGVYTATEYPAHSHIPLHNEQAYTLSWPMKLWFQCVTAAQSGGETPIADSREVYRRLDPKIVEIFERKKVMYVRNYGGGLDVSWEDTFNTEDEDEVEQYCRAHKISYEWKDDDELCTRQICQATAVHPVTKEPVWFNQAHLFHISNLEPRVREALLESVDMEDLPRNAYYGDGSQIEDSILDEIRGVLDECTVCYPWQQGDILMLDNMLTAHARTPFSGERKVIVAMSEPYSR